MATPDDHKLFHGPASLTGTDTKIAFNDIVVFGVASNGTVEQWRSTSTSFSPTTGRLKSVRSLRRQGC